MEKSNLNKSIHLGRRVEQVRTLKGITQSQLGEHIGVTKQSVSKIERSESINEKRLIEICDVLGVTVEGLRTYDEKRILEENFNVSREFDKDADTDSILSSPSFAKTVDIFESLLEKYEAEIRALKRGDVKEE